MDISEYQRLARSTDRLLGDPRAAERFAQQCARAATRIADQIRQPNLDRERLTEEIVSLFWNSGRVTDLVGLNLVEVLTEGLPRLQRRWGTEYEYSLFDAKFPLHEQLPRAFRIEISEDSAGKVSMHYRDQQRNKHRLGSPVTNNAHIEDFFRFHDCLHCAFWAKLGWSPVMRALLQRKRKSIDPFDENEDGARAVQDEEKVVAEIHRHAVHHGLFKHRSSIPHDLLMTVHGMLSTYEVRVRPLVDWQDAIVAGYRCWRILASRRSGTIVIDMENRRLSLRSTPRVGNS